MKVVLRAAVDIDLLVYIAHTYVKIDAVIAFTGFYRQLIRPVFRLGGIALSAKHDLVIPAAGADIDFIRPGGRVHFNGVIALSGFHSHLGILAGFHVHGVILCRADDRDLGILHIDALLQ